jgi:hypothetical protein
LVFLPPVLIAKLSQLWPKEAGQVEEFDQVLLSGRKPVAVPLAVIVCVFPVRRFVYVASTDTNGRLHPAASSCHVAVETLSAGTLDGRWSGWAVPLLAEALILSTRKSSSSKFQSVATSWPFGFEGNSNPRYASGISGLLTGLPARCAGGIPALYATLWPSGFVWSKLPTTKFLKNVEL